MWIHLDKMLSRFDLSQHNNNKKSSMLIEKDEDNTNFYVKLTQRNNQLTFIVHTLLGVITGHYNLIVSLPLECILETINNFLLLSNVPPKPSETTDILAVSHFLPMIYSHFLLILRALLSW